MKVIYGKRQKKDYRKIVKDTLGEVPYTITNDTIYIDAEVTQTKKDKFQAELDK